MNWDLSPFLQFATELTVILAVAKLGGYLSTRLGLPSILGELLAGILLGPSLLGITSLPFVTNSGKLIISSANWGSWECFSSCSWQGWNCTWRS